MEKKRSEIINLSFGNDVDDKIWNKIARYNKNIKECRCRQEKIFTLLADFSPSLSACKITGIPCSLYTCPRI